MLVRLLVAALATATVPAIVPGAARPDGQADYSTKKVCDTNTPVGSRLGGVRRCRTAAERREEQKESREVVDRIQLLKPTICGPGTGRGNC